MNATRYRVWVEELKPPAVLRFSWQVPAEYPLDEDATAELVQAAVAECAGVVSTDQHDDGLMVEIDPGQISRYDLAHTIRTALAPNDAAQALDTPSLRVWAEDLSKTEMRITWGEPSEVAGDSDRRQRRRVAASLTVLAGVRSATLDAAGVVVKYEPERLERSVLGDTVRKALDDETPLRERADELLKRATTYGNLARKLALDDRISPLPNAAKQAVAARAAGGGGSNVAIRTASRFIPGATLIARVQTLLPLLTELSKWSREADPEVVDGHLASVGLDRETLRRDTITAHEIRFYARDSAAEHASAIGERASAGARQALATGKDMLASMREAIDSSGKQASSTSDDDAHLASEPDDASRPRDSSPEDPRSNSG